MERRIKLVFLDGLTADDVLKLKAGGFFDGVAMPMPQNVTGQEAVLKVQVKSDGDYKNAVVVPTVAAVPVELKPAKSEEPPVAQVEQQEPVAEPKGNGKKLAAKNARTNARYIVMAFNKKWVATFNGRTKGGLSFKLDEKDAPVMLEDGALIEELDAPEKVAADEVASDDVDLSVERLAGFTKLRDLIQYAVEAGIPAEGMAAFCEGVKNEVPLLQRISNIEDRVQRTLEVMGVVK